MSNPFAFCNLASIVQNGQLPGGKALKMFLYGLINLCGKFGACIIKCTMLPNFGVKKIHYKQTGFHAMNVC